MRGASDLSSVRFYTNVFDESGPRERLNTSADPNFSNWAGRKCAGSVHWGSDGGFYYFRFRVDLD